MNNLWKFVNGSGGNMPPSLLSSTGDANVSNANYCSPNGAISMKGGRKSRKYKSLPIQIKLHHFKHNKNNKTNDFHSLFDREIHRGGRRKRTKITKKRKHSCKTKHNRRNKTQGRKYKGGHYNPYNQPQSGYYQWGSNLAMGTPGYGLNTNIGNVSALANPMPIQGANMT
jgi:hypothetical protein